MPDKNKKVVSNRDCLGRRKGWWLDKGGLVVQGQQKLTLDLLCTRSLKRRAGGAGSTKVDPGSSVY
jgi:hypothetical protein